MNEQVKGLIIVAVVAIVSFPVTYLVAMLATGNARLEFNKPVIAKDESKKLKEIKHTAKMDSLIVSQSQAYLALEQERVGIQGEREKIVQEQQRLEALKSDLENVKNELVTEREKIQKLTAEVPDLEKNRIKQLSKVYGAMRADEAARILETLDDGLVAKIISALGDDRQKAKIMTAISKEKATRISKLIGK